jgi:hypothetical protein
MRKITFWCNKVNCCQCDVELVEQEMLIPDYTDDDAITQLMLNWLEEHFNFGWHPAKEN